MKNIKQILLVLFSIMLPMAVTAGEQGEYKHFANFNFEESFDDVLGNVEIKQNELRLEDDSERGGKVMAFDAATKGYLRLMTDPTSENFTVSFWVKRTDEDPTAAWRMPMAFYAQDQSAIYFTPYTSWGNNAYLVIDNKKYTSYQSLAGKVFENNKWQHVAITFSKTKCKLYMNGDLCGTATLVGSLPEFGTAFHYFGNYQYNNYSMSGLIDDINIFHSTLADNQIVALMNGEEIPAVVDPTVPFSKIDFSDEVEDIYSNVDYRAEDIEIAQSDDKRSVAIFNSNSILKADNDPIGNDQFTAGIIYRKESFTDQDNGAQIFKFSGDNGDNMALVMRVTDGVAKLEMTKTVDGVLSNAGLATKVLVANEWNSIVITQMYNNMGNGGVRIYINGTLAKTSGGYSIKDFGVTSWVIGGDGNSIAGEVDELIFYQRELTSTEIQNYSNLSVGSSINLTINPTVKYQTIRNFGGSDGWGMQPTGLYLSEQKKEEIAELLFSTEVDEDGNPKGVGFSSWRFNIGAGTDEQGDDSGITHYSRRSQCFLNPDMVTYDWSKQAGQRYFLEKAAKEYNVADIIGWQNSPPVYFTKHGLGFRKPSDPMSTILKSDCFDDYANFLSDVVLHFKEQGIDFDYITPVNEPQYTWACDANGVASQEGSPWTNQEIHDVIDEITKSFKAKGVDSEIFTTEAGAIKYLLNESSGHACQQLKTFWDPSSALNISKMNNVSKIVAAHSYWSDGTAANLVDFRQSLRSQMNELDPELEYFQTEYSLLGTSYLFGHSGAVAGSLTPMQCGVSLSRVIHSDLVHGNVTGWQWWTTVDMAENLSTEDRFALVRVAIKSDKTDGVYIPTKLLYTLGNYSFFIRPGMKRIDVTRDDNMSATAELTNQMFSAYTDEQTGRVVVVATNFSALDCAITLPNISADDDMTIQEYTPYITTDKDEDNMKKYPSVSAGQHYVMPPHSVITFVGDPKPETSVESVKVNVAVKIAPNPASNYVKVYSSESIQMLYVYDNMGRQVSATEPNAEVATIDCSAWSEGFYHLGVVTKNGLESKTLIIRR